MDKCNPSAVRTVGFSQAIHEFTVEIAKPKASDLMLSDGAALRSLFEYLKACMN